MHPTDANSEIYSSHSSACKSNSSKTPSSSVSPILQDLSQPKQSTGRKKRALNSEGLCITDSEVLDGLKAKEEEKMEKQRKKSEREEQRKAESLKIERRKNEADKKRKAKEIQRRNVMKKRYLQSLSTQGEGRMWDI